LEEKLTEESAYRKQEESADMELYQRIAIWMANHESVNPPPSRLSSYYKVVRSANLDEATTRQGIEG